MQFQSSDLRPIAFASRATSDVEQRYAATKLELMAVHEFVLKFKTYTLGRRFVLLTDHQALQWLQDGYQSPEDMIARWITELSPYDAAIIYHRGVDNTAADALSRIRYALPGDLLTAPDAFLRHGRVVPVVQDEAVQVGSVDTVPSSPLDARGCLSALHEATHRFVAALNTDAIQVPCLNWAAEQLLDPAIALVRRALLESPAQIANLNNQSLDVKRLWLRRSELVLKDGILLHQFTPADKQHVEQRVVVPANWRCTLTLAVHGSRALAHRGASLTLAHLARTYWWPGMETDIRTFLRSCSTCQHVKSAPTNMTAPLCPIPACKPFERVSIDLMGPMAPSRGYRYILVLVDAFSRWVEAVPLCNKSAETVALAILRTWIARFGVMQSLHSDNGLEFENAIIHNICEWTGVTKTHTTPYHPQGNGAVERMNRTLREMLTCLCKDFRTTWSDELPFALWAVRSCISRATGHSPFHVLFGRPMAMPFDYATHDTSGDTPVPLYNDYVVKLISHLQKLHARIKESISTDQLKMTLQHDKDSLDRSFSPGELVLVREQHPPSDLAPGEKFYERWRGPYEVLVAFKPTTYALRHRSDGTEMTAHLDIIKAFHQPPTTFDDVISPQFPDIDDSGALAATPDSRTPDLPAPDPVRPTSDSLVKAGPPASDAQADRTDSSHTLSLRETANENPNGESAVLCPTNGEEAFNGKRKRGRPRKVRPLQPMKPTRSSSRLRTAAEDDTPDRDIESVEMFSRSLFRKDQNRNPSPVRPPSQPPQPRRRPDDDSGPSRPDTRVPLQRVSTPAAPFRAPYVPPELPKPQRIAVPKTNSGESQPWARGYKERMAAQLPGYPPAYGFNRFVGDVEPNIPPHLMMLWMRRLRQSILQLQYSIIDLVGDALPIESCRAGRHATPVRIVCPNLHTMLRVWLRFFEDTSTPDRFDSPVHFAPESLADKRVYDGLSHLLKSDAFNQCGLDIVDLGVWTDLSNLHHRVREALTLAAKTYRHSSARLRVIPGYGDWFNVRTYGKFRVEPEWPYRPIAHDDSPELSLLSSDAADPDTAGSSTEQAAAAPAPPTRARSRAPPRPAVKARSAPASRTTASVAAAAYEATSSNARSQPRAPSRPTKRSAKARLATTTSTDQSSEDDDLRPSPPQPPTKTVRRLTIRLPAIPRLSFSAIEQPPSPVRIVRRKRSTAGRMAGRANDLERSGPRRRRVGPGPAAGPRHGRPEIDDAPAPAPGDRDRAAPGAPGPGKPRRDLGPGGLDASPRGPGERPGASGGRRTPSRTASATPGDHPEAAPPEVHADATTCRRPDAPGARADRLRGGSRSPRSPGGRPQG